MRASPATSRSEKEEHLRAQAISKTKREDADFVRRCRAKRMEKSQIDRAMAERRIKQRFSGGVSCRSVTLSQRAHLPPLLFDAPSLLHLPPGLFEWLQSSFSWVEVLPTSPLRRDTSHQHTFAPEGRNDDPLREGTSWDPSGTQSGTMSRRNRQVRVSEVVPAGQ